MNLRVGRIELRRDADQPHVGREVRVNSSSVNPALPCELGIKRRADVDVEVRGIRYLVLRR
jgi:hypothetical protein